MAKVSKDDRYSHPEENANIKARWEKFISGSMYPMEGGSVPDTHLRMLIQESWLRCQSGNVDPLRYHANDPLDANHLASLRARHARLIDASTPCMAQARDILSPTGTVMILTDPQGTILDVEGDSSSRVQDPLQDARLIPGGLWSESITGTNAIGTALKTGQPVQIHAAEHFCEGIQRWTCSATVVRDPVDRSVLGVIDVSGLSANYSRHSLALAMTTADRIESRLSRLEMEHRYSLVENSMSQLSAKSGDGIILFDRRGFMVKAESRAAAVLAKSGLDTVNSNLRIGGLNLDIPEQERPALPEWLCGEWVEPVMIGNRIAGSIVHIPIPRVTGFQAKPSRLSSPVTNSGFEKVLGRSPAINDALAKARHLSKSRVSVLLLGETGVGKELFASGIHHAGSSTKAPFVVLNCGGLSKDLLSSELFGYGDGAFTGARKGGLAGKIEAANGGTLFLDEIGEMPLDIQPHLLRVLESGEIYRLGENAPRKVSFRLIAATNRDLRKEVSEGRFRMDLFYRIAVTSIRIPSLRDRAGDIPLLVHNMVASLCKLHNVPPKSVSPGVISMLESYNWPGNVRELRNIIESMLLMCPEETLAESDLPPEILPQTETQETLALFSNESLHSPVTLEQSESEQIRHTIHASEGNLTLAAQKLGIAKSTLYLKLKKYGLGKEVEAIRASER